MDETQRVAWMARRLTLGAGIARLEEFIEVGSAGLRTALAGRESTGKGVRRSPWDGLTIPTEISRDSTPPLLDAWLDHLRDTDQPFHAWMTWFWHDYFAVSAAAVRDLTAFTGHIDLLAAHALGSFDVLLREVTIDPAMLVFLDGRRSQAGEVNENYGRELLELYSLGIGNYSEADVRAAAVALTGWVWRPGLAESMFIERRHDPTPHDLLGRQVDDLDSVIDVVTSNPACAQHVVEALAVAIIGRSLDDAELAAIFNTSGLDLRLLAASLIDRALEGEATPVVLSPVAWLLQAEALTRAQLDAQPRLSILRQMGQLPGVPPNVGGYPGAETWAGPSTTVGRFRGASAIAARTHEGSPILDAARSRDWEHIAFLAARPDGFSAQTMAALNSANTARRDGREALAAVLMTPELAVA